MMHSVWTLPTVISFMFLVIFAGIAARYFPGCLK